MDNDEDVNQLLELVRAQITRTKINSEYQIISVGTSTVRSYYDLRTLAQGKGRHLCVIQLCQHLQNAKSVAEMKSRMRSWKYTSPTSHSPATSLKQALENYAQSGASDYVRDAISTLDYTINQTVRLYKEKVKRGIDG